MNGVLGPQQNGLFLYIHISICDGLYPVDLSLACHFNRWMRKWNTIHWIQYSRFVALLIFVSIRRYPLCLLPCRCVRLNFDFFPLFLQHDELSFAYYSSDWYNFQIPLQRMLHFVMMHAQRPLKMRALLVDLNLRTFIDVRGHISLNENSMILSACPFCRLCVGPTATSICSAAPTCIRCRAFESPRG